MGNSAQFRVFSTNYDSTPYTYLCGSSSNLNTGGYVFTAIINGNIVSGNSFESLSDEDANTSYVVLKIIKHLSGNRAEEQFVRVNPSIFDSNAERLVCLPFIVDNAVTSVDFYVEVRNNPDLITVAYWDVLPAAKANETVVKDKDSAITTSYTGKYGTQTTSDLSKRTSTNTKQTVTNRVGASQTITAVNTYQSSTSEKIIKQDDGMSLVRTYTYDAHGNVIKEEVTAKNNASLKMKREYSYTSSGSDVDGNALFSEADENGNSTNYAYESGTGFLKRTTLPGINQNIDYTYYGAEGLLKEVKALANSSNNVEETSNTFCYNLGYLTRVKHDSCTYDFTYDGFGRITAVSVGGRIIIRTAYIESGTDIDGVEGATSKTVTGYYNDNAKTGVLCGEVLCGQATVDSSGKKSGAAYLGNLFCGQYFLAANNMTGQSNDNWQNNVYASYYNCYGELIKVRHAINRELTDVFDSDADYVSVTDECEYAGNTRILTYVVGTAKYVYNYDRTTGDLLDSTEYENDVLKLKHETVSYDKFGRTNGILFTLDNGSRMVYNYIDESDYEDGVASVKLPNNITCSIADWISIGISAALSGVVSGVSRNSFFKDGGKKLLEQAHKQTSNITKRLLNGYYYTKRFGAKSAKSATKQIIKTLQKLNFGKGFWKDWLISGLSSVFSNSFSRGLNGSLS